MPLARSSFKNSQKIYTQSPYAQLHQRNLVDIETDYRSATRHRLNCVFGKASIRDGATKTSALEYANRNEIRQGTQVLCNEKG